jgi:excisionase family DNA binding protein
VKPPHNTAVTESFLDGRGGLRFRGTVRLADGSLHPVAIPEPHCREEGSARAFVDEIQRQEERHGRLLMRKRRAQGSVDTQFPPIATSAIECAPASHLSEPQAAPPAAHAPHPAGRLLSAREAAAMLGIGLSTFKEVVRPDLPTVKVGRRVLFSPKDLEQWQDNHTVGGARPRPVAPGRSFASGIVTNAITHARAKQFLEKLRRPRRGSTPTT